ncbi:MAG: alcohol dehydrogenase [Deltaproteobacteria bacterium]|nr:MAG: alcohol dehydrogenase [Deltaproteobacteria bacterium]
MRQIWIPTIGGPDVLELRDAHDPDPGPGEVRVRVRAAGVNFADILARMGLYPDAPKLPAVVGYEVAGVVDAVGSGVDDVAPGVRVVALTRFGGYSDVVCVPRGQVVELPDDLSFEQAAALPVQYLTAWLMLVRLGNLQAGERVLIHSAGGGVGLAAIQIARWKGAEIFGTASAGKHERLRAAGVHHCIDYRTQDFAAEIARITGGAGVHLVIDAVGGDSFRRSYASLAPLGRLFLFGVSSFAPGQRRSLVAALRGLWSMPKFRPIRLMNENRGVFGVNLGHLWDQADRLRAMLVDIVGLVRDGVLAPVVDRTFPFDRAADAHRYIQERRNFGKVLLVP